MAPFEQCPVCNFRNPAGRDRCFKCSALLHQTTVPKAEHLASKGPDRMTDATGAMNRIFERWRRSLEWMPPENPAYRWASTAALLAVIPGLGQWYNYQPRKAIAYGTVQAGLAVAVGVTFFESYNNWLILALLLWTLLAMADAIQQSYRLNGRIYTPRLLWAYWFGLMLITGSILSAGQWVMHGVFTLVTVTNDLGPGLRPGDKVLVARWPYWLQGRPQLGDVVLYNPRMFSVQTGEDLYTVRQRRTFGVISAYGGDTISWRDEGRPQRNGKPIANNELPLYPEGLLPEFELTIPKDEYGILLSTATSESYIGMNFRVGTPRSIARNPKQGFEQANSVDIHGVIGQVLFRYNPPQRRTWFGSGSGIPELRDYRYPGE